MTQAQRTKLLLAALNVAAVNSAFSMQVYQTSYETRLQEQLTKALKLMDELAQEPVCHA